MKIVILGGGLSGLSAALKLTKAGHNVKILEKENYLGGLASYYEINWGGRKYSITKTYHHILEGDKGTIDLMKKLNLFKDFHKKKVKTGFIYKNKLYGFSTPMEILKFPLSLFDKFRLGTFTISSSFKKDWTDAERINAKDWITKRAGKKNFEIIFDRLVKNKFNKPSEDISAAWFGTRFMKESQSFLKKFGWLEGGAGRIVDYLVDEIEKNGCKIETGVQIKKISKGKKKKIVYIKSGKQRIENSDIVISTIPPKSFLKLYKSSKKLMEQFEKIEYLKCICLCVGFDFELPNYYWLNILDDLPFRVIFNHTSLYEDSAPKGKSVAYLARYFQGKNEYWNKNDKKIFDGYIKNLEKVIPSCSKKVDWFKIVKFEYSEAIFDVNFQNPSIEEDGIYFAGIYRIFPKIRNMASAIESGFEVAEKVEKLI